MEVFVFSVTPYRCALAALLVSVLLFSNQVTAQDNLNFGGSTQPNLDVQNFQPSASAFGIFSVESAQSASDLEVSAGFLLNFAKDPLVLTVQGENEPRTIVDSQLAGDLLFAIGFLDNIEVGLALPVYFISSAQIGATDINEVTVGDLRLRGKYTFLSPDDNPVGVAAYAQLGFPTGDTGAFTSSGQFYARPGVIVDTKLIPKLLLAANLSVNLQDERDFGELSIGSTMNWGFGGQYELLPQFLLVGLEFFGSSAFNDFFKAEETPFEGLLGFKFRTDLGVNFQVGAGGGIVPGYGAPAYRVFAGVHYANYNPDWDNDTILNVADKCPREPEDFDGFEDEEGCPDPDNDQDGVLDKVDSCPIEAEDSDQFEDEDGCPDPDNDKDGFPDDKDDCPNEAEIFNGNKDDDGCPDEGKALVTKELKILQKVLFAGGRATILKASFPLLNATAQIIKTHPEVILVEVQGHTDDVGNDRTNLRLSQQRADAVRKYLIDQGVEPKRLVAKGHGENEPAVSIEGLRGRKRREARDKNRRVQFEILERIENGKVIDLMPDTMPLKKPNE